MADLPKVQLPEKLPFSKRQLVIIGVVGVGGVLLLFSIYFGLRTVVQVGPSGSLTVWGVSDGTDSFRQLIESYQSARGVAISYEEYSPEDYDSKVLNALASGQGPDVLMVHNRALPRDMDKLMPADPGQYDIQRLEEQFPNVIEQDFTNSGQIYALPLYIDTLALIYNKDLFDQGGIAQYPKTWNDVQNAVANIRQLDTRGQISRAAVALGGSKTSINNGVDILNLLMLQGGTAMTNNDFSAADFFNPSVNAVNSSPGIDAFNFYLQFANAGSSYYTWSDAQPEALDSFAGGKTAMVFGYHSDLAIVKEKSPFINFGVAPMPQLSGSDTAINYPNYWGLGVSRQSKVSDVAWDFVLYSTTDESIASQYATTGNHPPALRSLIDTTKNDPDLGIFARQALTARSWYDIDENRVSQILSSAIQNVTTGKLSTESALSQAQAQVSHLMSAKNEE